MLLCPEGFVLFTEHKNVTYIFNPAACNHKVMKHMANKAERWELRLSGFRYEILHISGDDNVWADLLSHWGCQNKPRPQQSSIKALLQGPMHPV